MELAFKNLKNFITGSPLAPERRLVGAAVVEGGRVSTITFPHRGVGLGVALASSRTSLISGTACAASTTIAMSKASEISSPMAARGFDLRISCSLLSVCNGHRTLAPVDCSFLL